MPTAVITGASRGIGRAIAKRLAREYAIVAAARTEKDLKTLAAEIEQAGGSCRPVVVDVSDDQAVQRAFTQIQADVLVNNAGVGVMKPLLELTPADWRLMMSTNLDSLYYVTRALLPGMVARRSGFVITIGSLAGRNPFAGGTCYTATKHGVIGFAESLMLEVRQSGVRVATVMPGSVATDFFPPGRETDWMLSADDVAESVAHILSARPEALISRVELRPARPQRG